MSSVTIQIKGIAAELVLDNYMPADATIFNNWEDFYHFNDLIHVSQLLTEHISEIEIRVDKHVVYKGKIPPKAMCSQKSFSPVLVERALYLRTECAEQAVYSVEFEAESFDINKLTFETQDYDELFKVGKSFIVNVIYDGKNIEMTWKSATPVGNICLLCRFENGYLIPVFDAIKKIGAE
jgi:hypothetical protein